MSDTLESLRRKIIRATDLQSVVRTMKAVAASGIGQYENSIRALVKYSRSVELGLSRCLDNKEIMQFAPENEKPRSHIINAVVFGSDQGLVGQFNDIVAFFSVNALRKMGGELRVWAIGERVYTRLIDSGIKVTGLFAVPVSVKSITPFVAEVLTKCETGHGQDDESEIHLFYNKLKSASSYTQVDLRLLPLDTEWLKTMTEIEWPTENIPQVLGNVNEILRAFIREYLFISVFRVCAESLASENTSRLIAMQRAEKNITEMLSSLSGAFHELRKDGIDAELFDVIAGFEMLNKNK